MKSKSWRRQPTAANSSAPPAATASSTTPPAQAPPVKWEGPVATVVCAKRAGSPSSWGVAVDAKTGVIYVSGGNSPDALRRIDPDGKETVFARDADLVSARGICLDSKGNLYVCDNNHNCIKKVTPEGVVTLFAGAVGHSRGSADGNAAESTGSLYYPWDCCMDSKDNLYIADWANSLIRRVTPDGVMTTVAGIAGQNTEIDGPCATATLNYPPGLCCDDKDNLIVHNHGSRFSLRYVDVAAGQVSTLLGRTPFEVRSLLDGSKLPPPTINSRGVLHHAASGLVFFTSSDRLYAIVPISTGQMVQLFLQKKNSPLSALAALPLPLIRIIDSYCTHDTRVVCFPTEMTIQGNCPDFALNPLTDELVFVHSAGVSKISVKAIRGHLDSVNLV